MAGHTLTLAHGARVAGTTGTVEAITTGPAGAAMGARIHATLLKILNESLFHFWHLIMIPALFLSLTLFAFAPTHA